MNTKRGTPEKQGVPPDLFSLVFPACRQSSPDVAFRLIDIQKLPHLLIQGWVKPGQALCQVFMYGGFGNAELRGGGADGRPVFDDVYGQVAGPFFNICIQIHHSPFSRVQCI